MYLVSFTIKNFRKFREENNTIEFVKPESIQVSAVGAGEQPSPIAQSSTLIIGKNNVGKTTIARAFDFVIVREKKARSTDFNNEYLRTFLNEAIAAIDCGKGLNDIALPSMGFEFKIWLNLNATEADTTSLLSDFLSLSELLGEVDHAIVDIKIQVSIKEELVFKQKIEQIVHSTPKLENGDVDKSTLFQQMCDFINKEVEFRFANYNANNEEIGNLYLRSLFNIKEIKANRHLEDRVLSKLYGKIVKSEFTDVAISKQKLEAKIGEININITDTVKSKGISISEVLQEIEQSNHVSVDLSGNVTEKAILEELIKYSFSEGGDFIPENQFGLGYINLLNIIGEIVGFVDSYEDKSHQNQINLLFIEEPESFMHPQMQEFFISRIDAALKKALQSTTKKINCQLIITTHSSHIVNSKIHSSNSFNNINYICNKNKNTHVISLEDSKIIPGKTDEDIQNLNFLKKHIKFKASELFFSDAVIFVEGATEEALLYFYLEKHMKLRNFYISIFNINGAHGKVYHPLAKLLKVPTLIITDIDIKRDDSEKEDYKQITKLADRHTTNQTLIALNHNSSLLNGINYFEDENLYFVFQKDPAQGQQPTSLEEAIIIENYDNAILNNVLEAVKKNVYTDIVGDPAVHANLINNSYKLQRKIAENNDKSKFANELLFRCITSVDSTNIPRLPKYIQDGFTWLEQKLG